MGHYDKQYEGEDLTSFERAEKAKQARICMLVQTGLSWEESELFLQRLQIAHTSDHMLKY